MGQCATIHVIDQKAWEAAATGDFDNVDTVVAVPPVDLEKSWHAIHFILTGNTNLTFLGDGKQLEIVEEHCEAHSPKSVRKLAAVIGGRDAQELISTIDSHDPRLNQIYAWVNSPEFRSYLSEYLEAFLLLLQIAVDGGYGFMVVIT